MTSRSTALTQTTAFVIRSFRQESRLVSHHAIRGGVVLATAMLFFIEVATSAGKMASGLSLISGLMNCWYACLVLLGSSYFPQAVSEEKEEDTLPLLRMTGVRDATLLLGKSLPRLSVILLLTLVTAPFLLFAQTLGGVLPGQVFGCLLGFAAFAVCLSQAGLLAGTLCRRPSHAVSLTVILWLLIEFGAGIPAGLSLVFSTRGWPGTGESLSWFAGHWWSLSLWKTSSTYLLFESGESLLQWQLLYHLVLACVFFGISWLLFDRLADAHANVAAGSAARWGLGWFRGGRQRASLRAQSPAVAWKSWQFVAGGWPMFFGQLILIPALFSGIVALACYLVETTVSREGLGWTLLIGGIACLLILLSRAFGNVLNCEIHEKTLSSLCLLPQSTAQLTRELLTGIVPIVLPSLVCSGLGLILVLSVNDRFIELRLFSVLVQPWFWAGIGWGVVTLGIGTWLSTILRQGGMLLAILLMGIAIPFALQILVFAAVLLLGIRGNNGESFFVYVFPLGLIVAECAACLLISRALVSRIDELAGR